jgi:hypothetical protein
MQVLLLQNPIPKQYENHWCFMNVYVLNLNISQEIQKHKAVNH